MAGGAAIERQAAPLVFWAMCGVTVLWRSSATKSLASYPLLVPIVIAYGRSARPEGRTAPTINPLRFPMLAPRF